MKTLNGKLIVLAVTGSIAAVETIKLVHAIRRKGGEVQVVMSEAACRILHPDALTYASGRDTITRISGHVEHVQFCGDERKGDLLLIAPCTANTISKIASGIDDTPVTTFATTALGSTMPVIIVPAMHEAMFRHIGVMENLNRLCKWNITIVGPKIEEGKAKIADNSDILLYCERELMGKPFMQKHVLITSGRCEEPVDDVRILTTRSSGRMGQELAKAAFRLGADVTIIHSGTLHFSGIEGIQTDTAVSMHQEVSTTLNKKSVDIYISAAAISDYAPVRVHGKIQSGQNPTISLKPLPKILDTALAKAKTTIAFKLGHDSELLATDLLKKGVSLVAANKPKTMGSETGEYSLIDANGKEEITGSKEDIAHLICNRIIAYHLT